MGLVAFIMAYALFAFIFYILQVIAYWKIFTQAGSLHRFVDLFHIDPLLLTLRRMAFPISSMPLREPNLYFAPYCS